MLLKRELHQPLDYVTKVINPYTSLMACQWHAFLLACNTTRAATDRVCQIALNRKLSRIFYAKSRQTETFCVNLKGGVNFQVALKRNHVKRDLSVHELVRSDLHETRQSLRKLDTPVLNKRAHSLSLSLSLSLSVQFLGAFTKLKKATISFVMSVCPSVFRHGTTRLHWTDFYDFFCIRVFLENMSRKFKFHQNMTRTTGALHEGL